MKYSGKMSVRELVNGAMIAAIYVVLTVMTQAISFGPVQFRISEALCILPVFTPAAIPGLYLGCVLANFLGGGVPMDIVFGSLATLIGAYGTWKLRTKKWAACLPPIISNALIVPFVLRFAYGSTDLIPWMMVTVGAGEVLAVGVCGNILRKALERHSSRIFGGQGISAGTAQR
jgi:uncharacterized membrane protein